MGEQVELPPRQRDLRAGEADAPRGRVDLEFAEADRRRLGDRRGAAQDRVHAGDHLGRREGLGDVVVGAEAQARDGLVVLFAARGEQDDRGRALRVPPAGGAARPSPSRWGSMMSSTTRSGRRLPAAAASASRPSAAVRVS